MDGGSQQSQLDIRLRQYQALIQAAELKPSAPTAPANISTLEVAEREHILRALEQANWVVGGPNGAAAQLGMQRTTLQYRMQKLGLERAGSYPLWSPQNSSS